MIAIYFLLYSTKIIKKIKIKWRCDCRVDKYSFSSLKILFSIDILSYFRQFKYRKIYKQCFFYIK